MDINKFIKLGKEKAGAISLILAALLVITAIITFSQPLKYEANNKLLIQQDIDQFDPYNVFKINEYYNNLIKEIVSSESFFNQVLSSDYDINADYFGNNRKEQIKKWGKTIEIVSTDLGTMEIKTYHPNPKQAKQILLSTTNILINKNNQYNNLGDHIDIKIINNITTSDYPTEPNIILNFVYTILVAIVIILLYLYYIAEQTINNSKDNNFDKIDKIYKNINKTENEDIETDIVEPEDKTKINETGNEDNKNIDEVEFENDKLDNYKENTINEGEEVEIENEADINNLFNR